MHYQLHHDGLHLPNTGSFAHPLSLTPLEVGSIRKCRTSSLAGSLDLADTFGGGVDTFKARPKAPGNELESRTTNVPGALSLSIVIAEEREGSHYDIIC